MSAERPADRVSLDALLAHRDWVRALARRLVLDENDADDVVQETWRMAIEKPPRHAESLRGWLATVVRNAARMSGRSETRRAQHEAATPERAPTPSPEDLVAAAEMQTRLARAVLELDEPYRSTVLYRFNEGLETSEIAARLGVPVETVRTRLKRAIEKLRERMDVDLGDDRDAWCLLVFGVRANDVAHLAPTAGATAGGVAAGIAGGLAMAATTKVLVAAVLVAGAAWWAWPKDEAPARVVETATAPAVATETSKPAPTRREPRTKPAAADATTSPAAAKSPEIPIGPDVVDGRVIDDATDAPVAKVTVSLAFEYSRRPGKELSAATGADGEFRIPDVKTQAFNTLVLSADGYAECAVGLPWRDQAAKLKENDAGDVRIYRGKRVAGRVLAADGRTPVAGAQVRFTTSGGSSSMMWINDSLERATTGADGAFAIERIAPSHSFPYTVFAVAPGGVGWAKLPGDAGRADATGVDVVLRPNGAATVTVRDENGAPKVGAQIVASPRFEPLGPRPEWDVAHEAYVGKDGPVASLFSAKTDAHGVARFAALPTVEDRPRYDFIVRESVKAWKSVAVPAGADVSVEIVVPAAKKRSIVGIVHALDGSPVAGAKVHVGSARGETSTGVDGRFRFDDIDPSAEQDWIEAKADGYARVERSIKHDAAKDVVELEIVLKRPAPVEGRVVDQDGKPVAGAMVTLPRNEASINGTSVSTGADGRFAFPDATAGAWSLNLNPPPPADEWAEPAVAVPVHGDDRDVVVVLHRVPPGKARIVAAVVDESGAPLAPDDVMLTPADGSSSAARMSHGKAELGNGRLVVERVKTGHWQLWLRVPGRIGAVVPVEVAEGQTEVALRIVVGRPGKLRGRVDVGDTGAPLPTMVMPSSALDYWGLPEWARPHGAKVIGAAKVESDGTFEFPNVMPGQWRVWVRENGFVGEGVADVPAGGEGTTVVVLSRAAKASFRLGAESPSDIVRVEFAQGDGPWRTVLYQGGAKSKATTFEASLLAGAYRWRVTFPADNFVGTTHVAALPASGEVTLVAGETTIVNVPVVLK